MADVNEVVVIPEEAQIETVNSTNDDAEGTAAFAVTVGAGVGAGIVGTLLFQKLRKAWHEAKLKKYERQKAEAAEYEAELARRQKEAAEQASDTEETGSDE